MKTSKAWTEEDHRRLCAMVEDGQSWKEIGIALGRTEQACYTHHRRGHVPRGPKNRRRSLDSAFQARQAIAELPPRSLTAEFFGDPLPGRSALDQRRQMPSGPSISLAGMSQ